MIFLLPTHIIYMATQPVDLRKSFDTLSGWALEQLGHDVRQPCIILFFNKERTRCKMLFRDNTGLVLLCKRLDKGRFVPFKPVDPQQRSIILQHSVIARLLDGFSFSVNNPALKRV